MLYLLLSLARGARVCDDEYDLYEMDGLRLPRGYPSMDWGVSALMVAWQRVEAHLGRVVTGTPLCNLIGCMSPMVPVSCR